MWRMKRDVHTPFCLVILILSTRLMSRVACAIPFALFRFLYIKIMNTRWVEEDWWSQHDNTICDTSYGLVQCHGR